MWNERALFLFVIVGSNPTAATNTTEVDKR